MIKGKKPRWLVTRRLRRSNYHKHIGVDLLYVPFAPCAAGIKLCHGLGSSCYTFMLLWLSLKQRNHHRGTRLLLTTPARVGFGGFHRVDLLKFGDLNRAVIKADPKLGFVIRWHWYHARCGLAVWGGLLLACGLTCLLAVRQSRHFCGEQESKAITDILIRGLEYPLLNDESVSSLSMLRAVLPLYFGWSKRF